MIAIVFCFLGIIFFSSESSAETIELSLLFDEKAEEETQGIQVMAESVENNYSTNVSVETDKYSYYCATGQRFSFKLKITTEEPYVEGEHKYIGYLAVLDGGWQQIKSWYIDGGILEYTVTLNSSDYVRDDKKTFTFVASVFPVDDFTEGASLYDCLFNVKFLDSSFTLTYNANGGQCDVASDSIIYNLEYGELPIPTRTGYTFDGWYTSASGGEKITKDSIVTVTKDQTLYAHWKANSYTIILNANGGSCTPLSISGTYDSSYENLSNVSVTAPTGYIFDGWYTSASGGTKISTSSKITIASNHTLYAHWTRKEYTVRYNANGGSGVPSSQTKEHGVTLMLSNEEPWREGYDFQGWSASSMALTVAYNPGSRYTDNADITLYAVWKRKEYTVTYNANGGTGAPASQIKYHGETLQLSSVAPMRDGYQFLGWNTWESSIIPSFYAGDNYTWDSDVVLYAIWQVEDITSSEDSWQTGNDSFYSSGQSSSTNDSWNNSFGNMCFVEYNFTHGSSNVTHGRTFWVGEVLTIPSAPEERFGYRFIGWRDTYGGKNKLYKPGEIITLTEPLSLTAEWENMQTLPTIKILKAKNLKGTVEIKYKTSKKVDGYYIYFSNTKTFNKQLLTKVKIWKKGVLRPKRKAYKKLLKKLKKVKYVKVVGYKKKNGFTYFTKTTNKSLKKIK